MFSQYQTLNSSVFFASFCKWRPPFKQGETLIFLGVPPLAIFERFHGKLLDLFHNILSQVLCIPLSLFFKFYVVCHFYFILFFKIKGDISSVSIWGYFPPFRHSLLWHSVFPCCRVATKNASFCKKTDGGRRMGDGRKQ